MSEKKISWNPRKLPLGGVSLDVARSRHHEVNPSLWRPSMQLIDALFVPPNDPRKNNIIQRKRVRDTAGKSWFDMLPPRITPELKKDLQLLKLRDVMDPKRHYKKGDAKSKGGQPKYFQVGTVIESSMDFFSGRIPKRERRETLAEQLLLDPSLALYTKRKVREIEDRRRPRKQTKSSGNRTRRHRRRN